MIILAPKSELSSPKLAPEAEISSCINKDLLKTFFKTRLKLRNSQFFDTVHLQCKTECLLYISATEEVAKAHTP